MKLAFIDQLFIVGIEIIIMTKTNFIHKKNVIHHKSLLLKDMDQCLIV